MGKNKSFWRRLEERDNPFYRRQREIEREKKLDWSGNVARVQERYGNTAGERKTADAVNHPSGTPDNNSPGANVPTGRGSFWNGTANEDENQGTRRKGSFWSPEGRPDFEPTNPNYGKKAEADRSGDMASEEFDWVYGYQPGADSAHDQEMMEFLRASGINVGNYDAAAGEGDKTRIISALERWKRDNGYAAMDNDARRKMGRDMEELKKRRSSAGQN